MYPKFDFLSKKKEKKNTNENFGTFTTVKFGFKRAYFWGQNRLKLKFSEGSHNAGLDKLDWRLGA